jgi:YidC/Oxa1 family membrane protein insertase
MDRRLLLGVALMVIIALAPSILFKRPPQAPIPATTPADGRTVGQADSSIAASPTLSAPKAGAAAESPSAGPPDRQSVPEDTVQVTSPLYTYRFSTRGARMIAATLHKYHSTVKAEAALPLEILPADGALFDLVLQSGTDTIRIGDWGLTPSAHSLDVSSGIQTLSFTGSQAGRTIELSYRFRPDDYRIEVSGTINGVGATGGLLLIGLGHGLRNTEADTASNHNEYGIVTRAQESKVTRLGSFDAGETRTFAGPFEWVALKSKYFTASIVAGDSALPRIAGVTATARLPNPGEKKAYAADTRVSIPVSGQGQFGFLAYVGPMEFKRLRAIGHEFDDVNPYGWPGFRVVIRFFTTPVRWLLVTMHQTLGLTYGVVLILFGIMIKGLTWPLQAKAMRSSMKMQELQPVLKDLQQRYSNDPAVLNREMMALYKEKGVNPLGGCLPMLIPMPVLLALFVVFQYSIELRGTPFLWLTDLSAHDPLFLIPLIMGVSMFAVSKIGQKGLPPNPQMQMMVYVMPVMMTVLFARFPAGLNLYYAVQNLAGLPQQWMLTQERLKRSNATVVVGTKKK